MKYIYIIKGYLLSHMFSVLFHDNYGFIDHDDLIMESSHVWATHKKVMLNMTYEEIGRCCMLCV